MARSLISLTSHHETPKWDHRLTVTPEGQPKQRRAKEQKSEAARRLRNRGANSVYRWKVPMLSPRAFFPLFYIHSSARAWSPTAPCREITTRLSSTLHLHDSARPRPGPHRLKRYPFLARIRANCCFICFQCCTRSQTTIISVGIIAVFTCAYSCKGTHVLRSHLVSVVRPLSAVPHPRRELLSFHPRGEYFSPFPRSVYRMEGEGCACGPSGEQNRLPMDK